MAKSALYGLFLLIGFGISYFMFIGWLKIAPGKPFELAFTQLGFYAGIWCLIPVAMIAIIMVICEMTNVLSEPANVTNNTTNVNILVDIQECVIKCEPTRAQ